MDSPKSIVEQMIPLMQEWNIIQWELEALIQEATNKKGSLLNQEERRILIEQFANKTNDV